MKKLVLVSASLLVLCCLVLYLRPRQTGRGSEHEPATITILCVTSPETAALKAAAKEFEEQNPGIEIVFNEQGRLGYFTNVTTQLVGGTDEFDLVQDNTTYMTELAAAGVLEPWDAYLHDPELTDLEAYDLDDLPFKLTYGGQIYCIPTDLSSQIYYFRKDLIEEPAETWDELIENARTHMGGTTRYGVIFPAMTGGPEAPKIFCTVLWSFGGEVIDDEGNVVIHSDAARKAAEVYRALRPYMPEDVTTYNYPKVFDALKSGTVAQAGPFWNAGWNNLQQTDSRFRDSYGIALIPGVRQPDGSVRRVPQTHGWGLVMNANSRNKRAAWRFLAYVTSVEGFRIRGTKGGSVYRPSLLSDPENGSDPYFTLMAETYKLARPEAMVPYYTKLHEILNKMVAGFLTTGDQIEEILAQAEKEIVDLRDRYE